MGRYIGLWTNKGKGGGGLGPVKPFTRSTGITTDSNNHVTQVTLDDVKYTQMFYNNVGLVTGYNEDFGGNKKGWIITYTSQNLVDTVVERIPTHPDPQYDISASTTTLDENSTVTFNFSTVDVPDDTFYWKADGSNVTGSDFTGATVTGTVTTSGGAAQISLTTTEDVSTEGNETFQMKIYNDSGHSNLLATSPTVTITDSSVADFSHTAYYTPGSYSWTVPAGVTKARVIVIGGGGGGGADGGGAGGGAAMKYWSNLVSGGSYSLTVGSGGQRLNSSNGNNGSDSSFAGPGGVTIVGSGGYGWGNGGNTGQYGGGGGTGSNGDVNGTGGNGSPYANDPVSQYGYTTNPNAAGTNGGAGGGGGGADNGNAINGGAGSYFAGGGGGGGSDNGQGGDGGQGGPNTIYEFEQLGYTRAFGGGGGGTDGTNAGVFGGPGGSYGGGTGQGYGDGSYPLHGGHGGGYADGAGGGHRGEGQGQNAGGGGGGAFGGGGGGAGHQDSNNVAGAGGHGLVYISWGANPPTGY